VRPPHQARSQATLDRLERAAVRLLETRTWSQLTVAQLARAARSSVGSFYGRFRDKEALLEHLDERYAHQMIALCEAYASGRDASLAAAVHRLLAMMVSFHRERRGLIRALVLRARAEREPAWDERTRRMNRTLPGLLERLLDHRREIRHPDPERAVFLAFGFTFTALRDRILFPESVHGAPAPDDDELVTELTRLMLGYLRSSDDAVR
jgi:AcrR family transcriptional regulator